MLRIERFFFGNLWRKTPFGRQRGAAYADFLGPAARRHRPKLTGAPRRHNDFGAWLYVRVGRVRVWVGVVISQSPIIKPDWQLSSIQLLVNKNCFVNPASRPN